MIAAFDDAAAFEHIDAIGVFHSAEAVGDDKTRAAGAEAFEVAEPFAVRLTPASLVD